jgi:hypothetical protein
MSSQRGSKETLKKIHDKSAKTQSIPIIMTKDGKSKEYPSATVASVELKIPQSSIRSVVNGIVKL